MGRRLNPMLERPTTFDVLAVADRSRIGRDQINTPQAIQRIKESLHIIRLSRVRRVR